MVLGGEQTGGTLAVILNSVPPGSGPPLHVHEKDDELFLVVEGHISYFTDGCWAAVGPGGVVYFPRGTPHCFRNEGTTPALHWILTMPSGFEHFIARFTEEEARDGGPDKGRMVALMREYGYPYLVDAPQNRSGGDA